MKAKSIKMLLASLFVLTLAACKANYPVAQQGGKEDVAFLLFVSASNQSNSEVQVTLDNGTPFTAVTVKAKKANRRGTQYSVATGRHHLVVKSQGNVLYEKEVMLSSQEVKQIMLP